MWLTALAIWVTFRYHVPDRVILPVNFSKFQADRKKYASHKAQYLIHVSFLTPLLPRASNICTGNFHEDMRQFNTATRFVKKTKTKEQTTTKPVFLWLGLEWKKNWGPPGPLEVGGDCWRLSWSQNSTGQFPVCIFAPLYLWSHHENYILLKEQTGCNPQRKHFWFMVQC